jgi:hypothetical protein
MLVAMMLIALSVLAVTFAARLYFDIQVAVAEGIGESLASPEFEQELNRAFAESLFPNGILDLFVLLADLLTYIPSLSTISR